MQDGSTLKNSVFLNPRSLVCEMLRQEPSSTESGKCYRILQSVVLRTLFLFCDPGHNEQ
jgi:hypothetical protein